MFQAISLAVVVILTIVDQVTKYFAINTVKVNGPFELIPGFIQFRYAENTGAAFSSFSNSTVLLSVLTIVIIIVCLVLLLTKRIKSKFMNICLMLVISGGIGNVIDRVRLGYVVDFIEPLFVDFAVFNFADCCITVGAVLMIIYQIYELVRDRKKSNKND